MLPATVERHHGEQHMTSRSKPEAASAADATPHDQGESVARIIDQIDSDTGDDDEEMIGLDACSPQPSSATRQTPLPAPRISAHHSSRCWLTGTTAFD